MKKLKTNLVLFICLLFTITTFGQKIKNKKGVTYFDKTPMLIIKGGSLVAENQPTQIISHQSNKLLFVLIKHYYTYQGRTGYFYNEVRFADFDHDFISSYDYKPLVKSLYENGVFDEDGNMDEAAIKKYIKLYSFTPPSDDDDD